MKVRSLNLCNYLAALACALLAACGGGSSGEGTELSSDTQTLNTDTCAETFTGPFVTTPVVLQNFSSECDYFVRGIIDISSDLTIEAGTTIVMDKDASISVNRGRVTAIGSPDNRITIRGEAPLPGYWNKISFIQARPSRIEHVDIMDGGQEPFTGRGAALSIGSTAISLVDISVSNSYTYGLVLSAGAQLTAFSSNRFFGNQLSGLSVYPPLIPELDTQTDYAGGNEPNLEPVVALGFYAGSLGQVTWPALNAPYADSLIQVTGSDELTLSPGAQIAIYDDTSVSQLSVSGTLIARGTADAPVVFSSPPGRSSWPQLEVTNNIDFDHVVFREADDGIVLKGHPRVSISNTRFEAMDGYAINCVPVFSSEPMPEITIGENVTIPDTAQGLINPNCPQ